MTQRCLQIENRPILEVTKELVDDNGGACAWNSVTYRLRVRNTEASAARAIQIIDPGRPRWSNSMPSMVR